MKYLKRFEALTEKVNYSNKNLVLELCVAMVLLNDTFLDNILDKGLIARYTSNNQMFLTDMCNLLLSKNRLKVGIYDKQNKIIEDTDIAKINQLFSDNNFDIEKDWNILINARNIARGIKGKLLNEDLHSEDIDSVYVLLYNKDNVNKEDIVLKLNNGQTYSLFVNKKIDTPKNSSFSTFADDLIGENIGRLYDDYIENWDKLTKVWIKLLYDFARRDVKFHFQKFIEPAKIDTIGYYDYFDIKHNDPRYKNLGEYIKGFDKNVLYFTDFMDQIWKHREFFLDRVDVVEAKWNKAKNILLNSKTIENLLTTSLKGGDSKIIKEVDSDYKIAEGDVKMKLLKTVVEKLNLIERKSYYFSTGAYSILPERDFFRKHYDRITVKFDYHVGFEDIESNSDFNVKVKIYLDDSPLFNFDIIIKFAKEMNGKLTAKYNFEIPDNLNTLIEEV